ncbi:MAG: hypothetical protein KDE27_15710 [Planctomycetes bacterium]|nr:hypothetical protein [Planctomycetota bacterium]
MARIRVPALAAVAALALTSACSFHSVATHWNERVGPNGQPVYVRTVTNIGINLAVILPVLGNTTIDTMIGEMTREIAERGGDRVRVIQTTSENYWHGFPPFTWIVTPVITDVSVEYEPSQAEFDEVAAAADEGHEPAEEGRDADHGEAVPDPPPKR